MINCAALSLLPAHLVQFQWVLCNGSMVSHSAMTTKVHKLAKAELLFSYTCIFCLCTEMAHTSLWLHLSKVSDVVFIFYRKRYLYSSKMRKPSFFIFAEKPTLVGGARLGKGRSFTALFQNSSG